jgi:hypothetical protein
LELLPRARRPPRLPPDGDRYWYSEEISETRVELAGYYQVPLLPTFHEVLGEGVLKPVRAG